MNGYELTRPPTVSAIRRALGWLAFSALLLVTLATGAFGARALSRSDSASCVGGADVRNDAQDLAVAESFAVGEAPARTTGEYDHAGRLTAAYTHVGGDAETPGLAALSNHEVAPGALSSLLDGNPAVRRSLWTRSGPLGEVAASPEFLSEESRLPGRRLGAVSVDGVDFTVEHDESGRLVKIAPGLHLTYDPEGRLLEVRDEDGARIEGYAYDARGRMAAVLGPDGLEQRFAYDGFQMVAAYDAQDEPLWEATWGPGIDHLLEWRDLSQPWLPTWVPVVNWRRDVEGLWSTGGVDPTHVEYDPDGRVRVFADLGAEEPTCEEPGHPGVVCGLPAGMPFGFVSAWRSERTGLVYLRHRWYDPHLGQFLSHDPLGPVDSWNLYAYVDGDPVNRWDPTGLTTESLAKRWGKTEDEVDLVLGALRKVFGGDRIEELMEAGGLGKYDFATALNTLIDGQLAKNKGDELPDLPESLGKNQTRVDGLDEGERNGYTVLDADSGTESALCLGSGTCLGRQLTQADINALQSSNTRVAGLTMALVVAAGAKALSDTVAGVMVSAAVKGAVAAAKGGGGGLYKIDDGVRRSKAADIVGNKSVPARIKRAGQLDELVDLPIDQPRSPKSNIPFDSRFRDNNLNPARQGSTPPPIDVTPIPGEQPGLVPIPNIRIGPP